MKAPRLWMLVGERGVGKTTFCRALSEQARAAGWDVAGLLSPAVFENNLKVGILAEDIRTGESHQLASVYRHSPEDIPFGSWYFSPQTLAWGNRVLASSTPCDLLIVDELGPLELTQQMGWQTALEILPCGDFQLALVVIRSELQSQGNKIFNFSENLTIDRSQTVDHWVRIYLPKITWTVHPHPDRAA